MTRRNGGMEHNFIFQKIWNDIKKYPTIEDVAEKTGIKDPCSKAKRYRRTKKMHPEFALPPLLDRSKGLEGQEDVFHDDGFEVPHYTLPKVKRYVVTSAQYGAQVNDGFLSSLFNYCQVNDAELIVMPIKYGQLLAPISKKLDGFVSYKNERLHAKISTNNLPLKPTLVEPLSSLDKHGGLISQIFAHPKASLKMVATSSHKTAKAVMTTGAVTYPEYSPEKTGRVAVRDHSFGAVVVEIDGKDFHFRHIEADTDDGFYDAVDGNYYAPDSVDTFGVPSLVCGDWHVGYTCPKVRKATYGKGGIVDSFRPHSIYKHDFFDGRSISHHDEKDKCYMANKAKKGKLCLETELEACAKEANWCKKKAKGAEIYFVASNHNEHLDRWLGECRYVKESHNFTLGNRLASIKAETQEPAFNAWMRDRVGDKGFTYLTRHDDAVCHGVMLGMHGDIGSNGSRGSLKQFNTICHGTVTGHTHTPAINGDAYQVGTSTVLRMDYTKGASSWLNTHALVWPNGQVQLINIIGGKWRG